MSERSNRSVDVSVVIGFKDWGVDRLTLAVETLLGSFGTLHGEVIVSDYGSRECPDLKQQVERLGARHVYTTTDGVWSRSRALNAGFAASRGNVLVSTDADMLFSPRSMQIVGERILADPGQALVLQCRDLPEGYDSARIRDEGLQWSVYDAVASLRPRWGMGGMMAISRDTFMAVRGFDERMQVYGGEDMDFAQRVRWLGRRLSWVEHPDVRMFHMWHPSTRVETDKTPQGRAAIEYNRNILLTDKSIVRNTTEWRHKPADAPPLATVVIATRNRADYLGESISSVLAQTVRDIEVLVVDDGSEDETEQVVKEFSDPRLRYYRRPAAGIAAARNFAASVTTTPYTVIHDDDDLMFPDRIEHHFAALQGGDAGTYGGWIDFDDESGEVLSTNPGKQFSFGALVFSGRVFAHATLMLQTDLLRLVGYDESIRSGSDYNLAIRLSRHGVNLRHSGHFHLVRRVHDRQVTLVDSDHQKGAARLTVSLALSAMSEQHREQIRAESKALGPVTVAGSDSPREHVHPYLPDSLVQRDAVLWYPDANVDVDIDRSSAVRTVEVVDRRNDHERKRVGFLPDVTWRELAAIREAGIEFRIVASRWAGQRANRDHVASDLRRQVARDVVDSLIDTRNEPAFIVLNGQSGHVPALNVEALGDWSVMTQAGEVTTRVYALGPDFPLDDVLGVWEADEHMDIEFHHRDSTPGSAAHWATLEGLTK